MWILELETPLNLKRWFNEALALTLAEDETLWILGAINSKSAALLKADIKGGVPQLASTPQLSSVAFYFFTK